MAITFNKFECFVEDLAEAKHNLATDTLKLALTNTAPNAADNELADISQIANGGGYTTGGAALTVTSSEQTSGTYRLIVDDVVFTGTAGGMAQWRYLVLYNDTPTGDPLIGWYDYGSGLTLLEGDSFTADFDPTNGIIEIT